MEGVKRYFYIVLGFVGVMLSGITLIVILIQIKFAASITLSAFCVISWLLFIITIFQMRTVDDEADVSEIERTSHAPADPVPNQKIDTEKGEIR